MRRRRLEAFQRSPDWPGKGPTWRWEPSRYDQFLLLAASMLEVAVPEHDGAVLPPEVRALVEDRLSLAGLDGWSPRVIREGGVTDPRPDGDGKNGPLAPPHRAPLSQGPVMA